MEISINGESEWLYNRCHLIGYQLTGLNAVKENLMTGTRYFNVEGMLPFEDSVAVSVRSGERVLYRVTPIFVGLETVARGVLMEAKSLDGNLSFCAFIYNVQPGVTIDYITGHASVTGDTNYDSIYNFD